MRVQSKTSAQINFVEALVVQSSPENCSAQTVDLTRLVRKWHYGVSKGRLRSITMRLIRLRKKLFWVRIVGRTLADTGNT
jgi:hypothetical protein